MNKRDTGFQKRACKKRTKQNCHLFWREIISKLPRQYTHMITRDTTYETIFFLLQNTRRDCCLLILSLVYIILLVLNLSTAIRRMDNLGAVPALRCFLFLPLFLNCNCNFVGQQFLNEAMTSEHLASLLSYFTIYFQFLVVIGAYYLKKLQVYEKGMVILNLLRVGWKQIKVHSFNSIKKGTCSQPK